MTEQDDQQDHLIRLLAPRHHLPASVQDASGAAARSLMEGIMRTETTTTVTAPAPARRASWFTGRRWLAIAVPTVAAGAALAFAISAVLPTGSGPVGPAAAQALQITTNDGYVTIRINDPVADPQRYREELARYHLDIELILAPVTPDQVGKVIFSEVGDTAGGPDLEWIEAPGDCTANGNCSVGIKVPVTFTTYAKIVFGRTALPGEYIEGGSPEQDAQARELVGKSLAEVLPILASRGQTATCRVGWESNEASPESVPGSWIVYDATLLPDNVFALWVSAGGTAPPRPTSGPGWETGRPVPTATTMP